MAGNWLQGLLQANALLSSGGTYSEAMALVEKTLELPELDLLLESRAQQTIGYGTLIIEQSISIIEINALGRLPEDTLLGDGDATAGERLEELYSELEAYTQIRSKAVSNLREASEEMMSDFFRIWRTYGSTAAVNSRPIYEPAAGFASACHECGTHAGAGAAESGPLRA